MTNLETIRQNLINNIKFIFENYIFTFIAVLTAIFFVGFRYIPDSYFLLILNSLYLGSITSTVIIYGYYFYHTMFSRDTYTRERQFTISVGLQHLAYILIVAYSATYRRPEGSTEIPVDWMILLSRYVVIVATTLQVFSPDMGQSLFYGLNRKVLLGGMAVGLVIAVIVMLIQVNPTVASALGL